MIMIQYYHKDKLKRWPLVSQHPQIASISQQEKAETYFLPILMAAWQQIEQLTGHRWQATSYWRDSPSHRRGEALDLAPEIHPQVYSQYAVNRGSDPVLYKREALMRALQQLAVAFPYHAPYSLGVYVEPDHLHLQVMKTEGDTPEVRIFKWKQPKYAYADTNQRLNLPLLKINHHEIPY